MEVYEKKGKIKCQIWSPGFFEKFGGWRELGLRCLG